MYYTPRRLFMLCLMGCVALASHVAAQDDTAVNFQVDKTTQRLEMVVNSSRILTVDEDIPRVLVANPDIMRVVPLSPNQVQVSAVKPGVTQVNLWDRDGDIRSVDVIVYADARQLELVLQSEFPKAAIRVKPIGKSVLLTGSVNRPDTVGRIVEVAETFYPKVINNIAVGGIHQVQLHVRVMEVSRTKLRAMGFDWSNVTGGGDFVIESAAGLLTTTADGAVAGTGRDTISFGIVDGNRIFNGFVEALRANNLIKILAEPTLTAVSGRPAYFREGGEFPVLVPQGLGQLAVEYKQFGTRVDFVPIVLGNGNIRLEVRPSVSEVDPTIGVELDGITVPGVRDRVVETAVEMRSGQTLAIAGLIQNKVTAENVGLPFLAELPWAGALFRRVNETVNEIELLIVVRPELVAPLDSHQVPPTGPGEHTVSPSDVDLLARGYLEVPRTCPDARCQPPMGYNSVSSAAGLTNGVAFGDATMVPTATPAQQGYGPVEYPVGGDQVPTSEQPAQEYPAQQSQQYPVQQYQLPQQYPAQQQYPMQQQYPVQQQIPTQQQYPIQQYPVEQGPTKVYEPFQHPNNPLHPATGRVPTGVPTAQQQGTVPAVGAQVASTQNQFRQVQAQVPVVAGKQSNLFGPTGYDELK